MAGTRKQFSDTSFCSGCRKDLPIDNFYFRTVRRVDGVITRRIPLSECKDCTQKRNYRNVLRRKERGYVVKRDGSTARKQAEYSRLYKLQEGRCAICGLTREEAGTSHLFHLDHDHVTGQYRGILCHRCNLGLGNFRDDISLFRNAITYLESAKLRYNTFERTA